MLTPGKKLELWSMVSIVFRVFGTFNVEVSFESNKRMPCHTMSPFNSSNYSPP